MWLEGWLNQSGIVGDKESCIHGGFSGLSIGGLERRRKPGMEKRRGGDFETGRQRGLVDSSED
jgi:hypothetical protein